MRVLAFIICAALISASALVSISAQDTAASAQPKRGSIKFTAQVEINGKTEKLDRKRFYLVRGSRQQNAQLIKKIAATEPFSQDCYYANLRRNGSQVSDEFVCWLKNNDCESPYCREIKTSAEAEAVPEFAAAYRQSLREYKTPVLALKWLTTNLPANLRAGFYDQQKSVLRELVNLGRVSAQETTRAKKGTASVGEGFQSIMTDRLGNAYFLDIDVVPPENKKTETYLVTNLLPIVFGDTGYSWTCEVEVDPAKPQAPIVLKNEIGKKKCEVVTKKISAACSLPECQAKASKTTAAKTND
ncbi:MAG: hypothetical protein ABI954_05085 [Pyrinomonadaceae bacterium]